MLFWAAGLAIIPNVPKWGWRRQKLPTWRVYLRGPAHRKLLDHHWTNEVTIGAYYGKVISMPDRGKAIQFVISTLAKRGYCCHSWQGARTKFLHRYHWVCLEWPPSGRDSFKTGDSDTWQSFDLRYNHYATDTSTATPSDHHWRRNWHLPCSSRAQDPSLDISCIVAVSDSGGSSARLKDEFGFPPVGDLRQSLTALADPKTQALLNSYYYIVLKKGTGLRGHSLGNLILTALQDMRGRPRQHLPTPPS